MNAVFLEDGASSECNSGWTLYLQHSSLPLPPSPPNNYCDDKIKDYRKKNKISRERVHKTSSCTEEVGEEEEDSSMVSDASSGPPHFDLNHVDYAYGYCYGYGGGDRNNKKIEINTKCNLEHSSDAKDFALLDDTASSPNFFFSPKTKKDGRDNYNVENDEEVSNSSLKSLIDYSNSPAFSANHFQGRSTNLQGPYDHEFLQTSLSTDRFQQNQWF